MKKIREVIVVEGKSDTQRIQNIIPADTIETNGSAIDDETIELIEKAHQLRGVIVFKEYLMLNMLSSAKKMQNLPVRAASV